MLRALREILAGIYGIDKPARHASYRRAVDSLEVDARDQVWLHDLR